MLVLIYMVSYRIIQENVPIQGFMANVVNFIMSNLCFYGCGYYAGR